MSGLIDSPAHIWIAEAPVDMRRGLDGLSAIVQQSLGHAPCAGSAFTGQQFVYCGCGSSHVYADYCWLLRAYSFSPDGRLLAIAGSDVDKLIRLWDIHSSQLVGQPLKGHTASVTSVSFSPDGKRLVSGSDDTTVRLWDTDSGQPIGQPLTGQTAFVKSVSFSPDGKRVASASYDETLRLWDVDPHSWQRRACIIANRNLSAEEWQKYLGTEPYRKTCLDPEPESVAKSVASDSKPTLEEAKENESTTTSSFPAERIGSSE